MQLQCQELEALQRASMDHACSLRVRALFRLQSLIKGLASHRSVIVVVDSDSPDLHNKR
jgi:hypothetical protein